MILLSQRKKNLANESSRTWQDMGLSRHRILSTGSGVDSNIRVLGKRGKDFEKSKNYRTQIYSGVYFRHFRFLLVCFRHTWEFKSAWVGILIFSILISFNPVFQLPVLFVPVEIFIVGEIILPAKLETGIFHLPKLLR